MTVVQHTSVQWEAIGNLVRERFDLPEHTGLLIAECPMNDLRANKHARQISAAPDLLAIVVRLESFLTRQGWRPDFHSPESEMLRDCRAAMAKVQGDGP